MAVAVRPTVDDLARYLGVPVAPDMADHLAAAIEAQAAACDTVPYTASLKLAAVRRAARSRAARSSPQGVIDAGEAGSAPIPRWDAEIERLESDRRLGGFA